MLLSAWGISQSHSQVNPDAEGLSLLRPGLLNSTVYLSSSANFSLSTLGITLASPSKIFLCLLIANTCSVIDSFLHF